MITKPKLLLTGASGFLGGNFIQKYADDFDIYACYLNSEILQENVRTVQISLEDHVAVNILISDIRPDYIVHLAALTDPNACEINPELSYACNVISALNLASSAQKFAIPLMIASTDLVFDGEKGNYNESDPTGPLSVYGKHKLEAEFKVKEIYPEVVIARIPLMYGASFNGKPSFIQKMVSSLKQNEEVNLFTDEFRKPSSADEICNGIKILLNMKGITVHLGGNTLLSRYQIGEIIADTLHLDKKLLKPVLLKDHTMAAPRPKDVSLDNSFAKTLGWIPDSFSSEFKKIAASLLCLFFICLSVFAQKNKNNIAHTLLWKIEKKGLKSPSYIYGTMHSANDKVFHLMDSVSEAIKSCESFALEINADSINQIDFLGEMMMPAGKSLKNLYPQEIYDSMATSFQKTTGYSLQLFDNLRPIYVYVTLSQFGSNEEKATGTFLDMFLFKYAKQNGKTAYGLERASDQLRLLGNIPMERQLSILKDGVLHSKSEKKTMDTYYDAYENSDFETLMKEEMDTTLGKNFAQDFIITRNHHMAEAASIIMQEHSIFIAIGAGHLAGDEGILNLLRLKGFKVSPVFSSKRIDPKIVKSWINSDSNPLEPKQ